MNESIDTLILYIGDLGLQPNLLTDRGLDGMLAAVRGNCGHVDPGVFVPRIKWAKG